MNNSQNYFNQNINGNPINPISNNMNRSQSAPLPYKMGSLREEFCSFRMDYLRKE